MAILWLINTQASSGRALLERIGLIGRQTGDQYYTHALTPPLIISIALVVPTSDLVSGSSKITDATASSALSEVAESKIA